MKTRRTKTWKAILGIFTEMAMAVFIMAVALGIAWLITL